MEFKEYKSDTYTTVTTVPNDNNQICNVSMNDEATEWMDSSFLEWLILMELLYLIDKLKIII